MTERASWLEALLSANGAAHALLAPEGRILLANQAFAEAFGVLPDALEGKGLDDIGIPAVLVPQMTAQLRRVAVTGTPVSLPGLLPRADVTLTPVRNADGLVTAIAAIGAAVDGADAALLAAQLAAARAEADAARVEAARIQAASTRFLSTAAHDLRQPFQAIHLFHHLMMGRLTEPSLCEMGDKLGQAIAGAETLLNALIDVSRLEAGAIKAQPCVFPVDETLCRMLQEFAPEAEARGLRFNVRAVEAEVVSDPILLERLLRPLLSNALRYTERGGVLLSARRRGGALRIEVWDSGLGIDAHHHAAIFDDFHQLDEAARLRKQGLGLGLSIARRLAALLGVAVTVRSRPGKGSVFAVDLPLADGARDPVGALQANAASPGPTLQLS